MENKTKKKEVVYSTGCDLLDLTVGGGERMGFPGGWIINLVGDSSTGKTLVASEINAANYHKYKKKFKYNYDDGEEGYTFDTQKLYGFDLITKNSYKSKIVQDFDVHCNKFLKDMKEGEVGIYTLDSLDSLSDITRNERSEEREKNYDKGKGSTNKAGTYSMEKQKFLSQEFFSNKANKFADSDALLIIISQVRENINPGLYQKKFRRSGGKALDFYAHTCVWFALVCQIIKHDCVIGVVLEAYTKKSRTPRPFRKCRFTVYFDYGIDNIGSNLDYLFDLRTKDTGKLKMVKKGDKEVAKKICWKGKDPDLQNLREFLKKNEVYEQARKDKKKETGSANLSIEWMKEWIPQQDKLKKPYEEEFGTPVTRDELIAQIEKDPEMEKELKQRTIEKWEAIEESVKSNRKRKYT
jgi:RecA/RadA recombinase